MQSVWAAVYVVVAVVTLAPACTALDNGFVLPAMGWSSWNYWATRVNETVLLEAADIIVSSGLKDLGYQFINLDDAWAVGRNASTGVLMWDPVKFPRGIKYVADYIHSKGLKFGIYTARGSRTCCNRPGSDGHEELDAQTFADWGVDYLKEDSCGGTTHGTVWEQYARMRDALNKTGRPIYFSITQQVPWADGHPKMHCYGENAFTIKMWLSAGLDPSTLANSYLIEYCNNFDYFGYTGGVPKPGGFLSNLDSQQLLTYDNMTMPGAFNDNDMLEVCNGAQTEAEYRSQYSTWAIQASPLILGHNLATMDDACKSVLLNKDIVALNQDPLVSRAKLVYQWPDAVWPNNTRWAPHQQASASASASASGFSSSSHHRASSGSSSGPSAASSLAPSPWMALNLTTCASSAAPSQQFAWDEDSGYIRWVGGGQEGLCVTYLGYKESNVFLAPCTAWSEPNVGGQTFRRAANGSFYVLNNADKCLDVYNCDPSHGEAVQVCSCSDGHDADCYAAAGKQAAKCGDQNKQWVFNGNTLRPAMDSGRFCLTAVPLPSAEVNISMQVWAKPLHDGSIGVVAFNRGPVPLTVELNWAWFGLQPGDKRVIHDLWLNQTFGPDSTSFTAEVQPHDVRAVRLYKAD